MTIQAPHPEQILDVAIDFGLDLSGDGALVAIAPIPERWLVWRDLKALGHAASLHGD